MPPALQLTSVVANWEGGATFRGRLFLAAVVASSLTAPGWHQLALGDQPMDIGGKTTPVG